MRNLLYYITILFLVYLAPNTQAQSSLSSDSIQVYIEKAESLLKQYKYEESIEIAKVALQNAVFNDDGRSQGYIFNIIAKIYEINEDDGKALDNYLKALTHSQISKSKELETDLHNKIANLYIKRNDYRVKGLEFYDKSYKSAIKLKDTSRMIKPLLNLGEYYISINDYETAYQNLSPAEDLITNKSTSLHKTKLNRLLGKYYVRNEQYQEATESLKKAIEFATRETTNKNNDNELISTFHEELSKAYKTKSELDYQQQKYKEAYVDNEEYIKNLLIAKEIKKEIVLQKASVKFDVELKDEQIKQAKEEKAERDSEFIKWQISIILGVVLILISLAFLISSYKNNIQKKNLNSVLIEKNKELVNAKETAEQVSTLKSQFISTVSHELRTPLYGVIGLTSLLMENPEEKKKAEYLESLKFSGDYLLALINDVLQLSKIETKEVKLEKVSFDIRSLIEGIVNSLHSKQKNNNNTVHINIDKQIKTTLIGDSVRLSQILINLIGNALKFTNNGNIWIKVKCLEYLDNTYKLRFIIKDDGIGIPKTKQKTIFDNFAQVKNQNLEYEGTGLGLAIVKKLIHLHNSEIYIKSEEGVGSEFYFDLSYEKAIKDEEIASNKGENISIGTTNFNVLIVDDNRINQIVTQNILKKKGYTCDVASNGSDAIDMLKKGNFDLVLMDINMPEMNGLDATKVIRTFNIHIPIIALTAVEEGEIREQALSVGMNDVIIKPYDTQQFFQTIMRNIARVKLI
ncbi:response regulator [Aquimarina sp. MMG016]|uniref:tetratricopeptide repeat-containing hybrid sensor histidine kinase/response regulator n=1 Tax=Aquimarina sp. MMG016 TaxID=2822690 RepID=UPI001B3A49AF|nr:response regulator [Aquimarina sp. MMG016]MBQ4821293.1 response regulator [Aquimarina sp. MMG016]